MRKILYLSGTRADYGLMRKVLQAIEAHPRLDLTLLATGMHLMETRGYTLDEIKKDGFKVRTLEAVFESDTRGAMAAFVGKCIQGITEVCLDLRPEVILVLGDRGEMLAGATVGTYMGIPVAHIHGGEVTSTVDEAVRHGITKLSHLHFAATKDSAQRILRMGESPERIFVVGAPGLDGIDQDLLDREELFVDLKFDPRLPLALLIQHPVSEEVLEADKQIKASLLAIEARQLQTVVVYPNADAGGKKMIDIIKLYEGRPWLRSFSSLERRVFLSLMKHAAVMVGNSSAGLIEAPSFRTPVVNVGSRQAGRLRGTNVVDVGSSREEILGGIDKCLADRAFLDQLSDSKNPYGDGKSADRILSHLLGLKIDSDLLQKQIEY